MAVVTQTLSALDFIFDAIMKPYEYINAYPLLFRFNFAVLLLRIASKINGINQIRQQAEIEVNLISFSNAVLPTTNERRCIKLHYLQETLSELRFSQRQYCERKKVDGKVVRSLRRCNRKKMM